MRLANKRFCSGCSACYAACPNHAISMEADGEGFLYPRVDSALCVNCKICEAVCPSLNPMRARNPLGVYAAQAKDDVIRTRSSSGGVFSLLSKLVLKSEGVIFGAALDHDDWHVYHKFIEHEDDMDELRGSKYVQSNMGDCFCQVKEYLKGGKSVLFSGTPCQVAGLKKFLWMHPTINCENLLLVEIACHAVPSPLAWRKYLLDCSNAIDNGKIAKINFRCKNYGWEKYSLQIEYSNGLNILRVNGEDLFMQGFLSELFNRRSCQHCLCRGFRSGADLTIADFWGVASLFPEFNDDKGTSLVVVNTSRGVEAFNDIKSSCLVKVSDFNDVCRLNPALVKSKREHVNRAKFFELIREERFDNVVRHLLVRVPMYKRFFYILSRLLH